MTHTSMKMAAFWRRCNYLHTAGSETIFERGLGVGIYWPLRVRGAGSLPQQATLGTFAAHTFTLSLQRSLCVSNAVSYECVETLFISQRGDPGSVTLLA